MIILYALMLVIAVGVVWYRQRVIVAEAQAASDDQKQAIEKLRSELTVRDATIARMQQDMARADSLLLQLRSKAAESDSSHSTLRTRLAEAESTIRNLRGQIENHEMDSVQSKALFQTISNVAYDMVFVLAEDSTIIAVNRAAETFFQTDSGLLGEQFHDIIDALDLEDIVQRALSEEESLEEQIRIGHNYYRVRWQVLRYERQHVFVGVAMQNITQLVRLNRARRDMVANISHELSTPIANIRLIIDSLFHEQSRPKRKASIASLRAIARETESLQWTVQELHDLSMIESGQAIMKLTEQPVNEIVDAVITRMEEKLDQKNLSIVRHIPERLHVLCDREHLRRVFMNLIANAVKWSPEDGAITLSATSSSEKVTINVFDNGPGVPDDQVERIFERFYQVDTARSGTDGSGLGLAICKHIVEAHGGEIWAEGNSQGGGGRFSFTLINARVQEASVMDRGQHDFNPNAPLTRRDEPPRDAASSEA